ncbi:MAG: class I SAM-dependent methyltransferase [Cyanobacteria bacterium J06621_11]
MTQENASNALTDGVSDWFEPLYAKADGDTSQVPWALPGAVPYLTEWLKQKRVDGLGQTAVVVGCGLGDDAEALAGAGFSVTAFDVSASAISWAKKRFSNSTVNYIVADLFRLPSHWLKSFDLVFDFRTIQALPLSVRSQTIENIAALAKPNGSVLVMTYLRPDLGPDNTNVDGPPWPLTLEELSHFEAVGLTVVEKETFRKKDSRFSDRIQIQYRAAT